MKSWITALPLSCLLLSLANTAAQAQDSAVRRGRAAGGSYDVQANMPRLIAQALEIRQALLDSAQTVFPQPVNERPTTAAPSRSASVAEQTNTR